MKRYTKKVRDGLKDIYSEMAGYAQDKLDEGERHQHESVTAALEWVGHKQRQAERGMQKRASGLRSASSAVGPAPSVSLTSENAPRNR